MKITEIVEAILFASDAPLKADEIARADESLDEDVVEEAIRALQAEYGESERAFQVVEPGQRDSSSSRAASSRPISSASTRFRARPGSRGPRSRRSPSSRTGSRSDGSRSSTCAGWRAAA